MKKRFGIVVMEVLFFSLFFVSMVDAQSARNYIPEMKLLVSTDRGESWTENTRNLKSGQDFDLMFEASVRVPGLRLQLFGAKSINTFIVFPEQSELLEFKIESADSKYTLERNIPKSSIKFAAAMMIDVGESFRSHSSYDRIIFTVPVSHMSDASYQRGDRPIRSTLILRGKANKAGSYTIGISYEDRVSNTHSKTFTLVFNDD